jgi:LPXTG-motif cell wall-anchored protein
VSVDGTRISHALKSMPSEAAKAAAKAEATTIISGNTAKAGGGIATNGAMTSGSEGEWTLNIDKAWDSSIDATKQSAVPIYVVVDGVPLEYVMVGSDNDWHAAISGLPDPSSVQKIALVEGTIDSDGNVNPNEPTDTRQISYSSIDVDADTKTMSAKVTNAPKPETPPADNTKPETISTPTTPSEDDSSESASIPQTGDETTSLAVPVIAVLASLAVAFLARRRIRTTDEDTTRS